MCTSECTQVKQKNEKKNKKNTRSINVLSLAWSTISKMTIQFPHKCSLLVCSFHLNSECKKKKKAFLSSSPQPFLHMCKSKQIRTISRDAVKTDADE